MSKKILVIEDDADTRELLEEIFSLYDCEVFSAENAQEAMAVLDVQTKLDLVLTDLNVPGAGNQGEIVTLIRLHASRTDIPIVLLSGHSDIDEIAEKFDVGYLSKPVDISELTDLIK